MTTSSRYLSGAIGGVVGGIIFGVVLTFFGIMPTVASLIGSTSLTVAWFIELVASIIVGLTYAWWFGSLSDNIGMTTGYGMLHGLIWWVIGPLVILPLLLGSSIQLGNALTRDNVLSLLGYLLYGAVLGATYGALYFNEMSPRHGGSQASRSAS